MKASLLVRAVPALLIAGVLAGGSLGPALAQTGGSAAAPAAAAPAPMATTPMATGAPSSAPLESHGGSAAPATAASGGQAATANRPAAGPGRAGGSTMRSSVEQRITDLHARLHITPAQRKHWTAFAQVMRDNAGSMEQAYRQRAQHLVSMSALQDLESYARLEHARAQDVERLVPVFRTLYDSMSAQQKKDADQLFRTYARQHEPHQGQASSR